eukprot:12938745-Prorocentrum_lima.AAC.1
MLHSKEEGRSCTAANFWASRATPSSVRSSRKVWNTTCGPYLTARNPWREKKGYRDLLMMAHRIQRDAYSMLIPWVAPLKEKSDAPKDILRAIDRLSNL